MTKSPLQDNIQLLQSYYRFLMLGKYLEQEIFTHDFSQDVKEIAISTGTRSRFGLKTTLVKNILKQIHDHPDQKNMFGYLIEISSFRGIFTVMRELIDNNQTFGKFVLSKLNENYFAFEQIIRLIRNVLSHSSDTSLSLKSEFFIKQRDYLIYEKDPVVHFKFVYAKTWKERTGSKEYGIDLTIDFKNMKEGQAFLEVVSLHNLYLLSELCYNLCEIFRVQYLRKSSGIKKSIGKTYRKKYTTQKKPIHKK